MQEEILALRAPDVFNLSTDHSLLKFDCVKLRHKLMMLGQSSFKLDQDLYGLDQDGAAVFLLLVAVVL